MFDKPSTDIARRIIATPDALWQAWIREIATDPEMDFERILQHTQLHVGRHMPNADADKERWEEWLAGTYNLLAILGHMKGIDPGYIVGVDLLLRKWKSAPHDHTPPPAAAKDVQYRRNGEGSGS